MAVRLPSHTVKGTPGSPVSGSQWGDISPTLIARIYEVNHLGEKLYDSGTTLECLFVDDANLEATFNWHSPFEGSGAGGMAPTLMNMLQSGTIQPIIERIGGIMSKADRTKLEDSAPSSWGGQASGAVAHARGRTGITKLNSTQVFTGMAPVRLAVTIMLRAWLDPKTEVEDPLNLLMNWALPRDLAAEGTLLTAALDWAGSDNRTANSLVEAALPSIGPTMLAVKYKSRTYAPMVIESIGIPLNSPSDEQGQFVQIQVPVVLSSLTAWDGEDWSASHSPDKFRPAKQVLLSKRRW